MAQADSERAPLGAGRRSEARVLLRLFPLMLLSLLVVLMIRAGLNFWYVTFDETYDVRHVALADLTGDGHLDAFLSVGSIGDGFWRTDRVVFNDGHGRFTDSDQELGEWRSFAAATGDVDGDGHVDAIVASYSGLMHYQNDDSGAFNTDHYDASMLVNGSWILNVALADLDEDGNLDAFVTGCCGYIDTPNPRNYPPGSVPTHEVRYPYSEVWLNNGAGVLVNTRQPIGRAGSNAVALGDLNMDGAVDAFLANGQTLIGDKDEQRSETFNPLRLLTCAISLNSAPNIEYVYETPNTIWFNDGQGNFSDSGQQLGRAESMAASLGDVNGDGFLDAAVGNCGPDEIWFNDGQGNFSDSGQRLGRGLTWSVHMTDLDGDGDLDLFVGGETSGQAWLNNGTGDFQRGQRIRYNRYESIALGDVTGDGSIDVLAAGIDSYRVWQGQGGGRFSTHRRVINGECPV